jgi:hypothetical protein
LRAHWAPFCWQSCAQMPFWHICEQHAALLLHWPPAGVQSWAQMPFWHDCEQHAALLLHWLPAGRQACTQRPFWPLLLEVLALELLLAMPPMPELLDAAAPPAPPALLLDELVF